MTEMDSQTGQFDASAGQKKRQSVFRTDVRQVFDCIRYSDDPEKLYELVANDPSYREMNGDTYDMIAQHIKTNELMLVKSYKEKEGKVDMCKAIAELMERGRKEGFRDGLQGAILELLEELGQVPQQIVKLIRAEDDQVILSKWLKSAARAASIAEFEANM